MKPEQVPQEWVQAAKKGWWSTESGGEIAMAHALAAVAPLIAAAERERCIEAIAEYEFPLDIAADHQAMLDMRVGLDLAAHAIRALGDADD